MKRSQQSIDHYPPREEHTDPVRSPKRARNDPSYDVDHYSPPRRRNYNDNRPSREVQDARINSQHSRPGPGPDPQAHKPKRPPAHNRQRGPPLEAATKGLSDKIHSLHRLLAKATSMPADIRQEKERELAGYLHDQARRQERRQKSDMTGRYHFVRFLERKKAERKLKRVREMVVGQPGEVEGGEGVEKKAEERVDGSGRIPIGQDVVGGDEGRIDADMLDDDSSNDDGGVPLPSTQTKPQPQPQDPQPEPPITPAAHAILLHTATVDLNYTLFSPLDQKYISLFAAADPLQAAKFAEKRAQSKTSVEILGNASGEKPPLWYAVEKTMREGGSLEALRDGKSWGGEIEAGKGGLVVRGASGRVGLQKGKGKGKEKERGNKRDGEKVSAPNAGGNIGRDEDEERDGGFFER